MVQAPTSVVQAASGAAAAGPVSSLIPVVARAHRAWAARHLRPLGLYPGQELLLMLLGEDDEQSQNDLARALRVEPPTAAKMISRLEAGGFVTRERSRADARKSVVTLTSAGRGAFERVRMMWADLERHTVRGLSTSERQVLVDLLTRLAQNFADEVTAPDC